MNATSDRCLRQLKFDAPVYSVAWSPDGTRLAIGDGAGGVEVLTAEGRRLWRTVEDGEEVATVSWSFDGLHLVVGYDLLTAAYEAAGGRSVMQRNQINLFPVVCSPRELVFAECHDPAIAIIDLRTGEQRADLKGHSGHLYALAWSPDGERLASGSTDKTVRTWDPKTERCLQCMEGHDARVQSVSWSPDGQRIASGSDDHTVRIWENATGRCRTQCAGHQGEVESVAWSPAGNVLASTSRDKSVRLWNPETGREIHRLDGHTGRGNSVAFSPDGARLASASEDATVRIWDVSDLYPRRERPVRSTFDAYVARQTATVGRRPRRAPPSLWVPRLEKAGGRVLGEFRGTGKGAGGVAVLPDSRDFLHPELPAPRPTRPAAPLPFDLRPLPAALAQLTRLGIWAPCSHVRDLLRLTAGTLPDAEPLASHAGIREVVAMRWPTAARVGLVALLLRALPRQDEWRLPDGLTPTAFADALADGLGGDAVTPEAPPLPVAALLEVAGVLDERLLALLAAVGPDAVAADPSLPSRLAPQASKLPASTAPRRRLLGLRLRLDQGGPAHGAGAGPERTGIDLKGDPRALLPSQLALPADVLRARYVRGELLYRTRSGREPPRLRPTVVVLDVSPPTFGPVEATTRLAAHMIAASLVEARIPVVLVTAGGETSVRVLERPADLVEIWTHRSLELVEKTRVLHVARAMRETLSGGELEPVVVVLSHVFFGADETPPAVPSLRGLFVDYPGRRVRPAMAEVCERWESVGAGEVEGLGERLGRLVG